MGVGGGFVGDAAPCFAKQNGAVCCANVPPCQRDTIPLEAHFSTNYYMERAEIWFSALFVR